MKHHIIRLVGVAVLLAGTASAQQSPKKVSDPELVKPAGAAPAPPSSESSSGFDLTKPANAPAPLVAPARRPIERSKPLGIPFLEKQPVIDGKMSEGEWAGALLVSDFQQVKPGDNLPASEKTEMRIAYDSKNLYIVFHCFDNPGKVRATVAKRDAITQDDIVGLILDTFNDQRKAYVLAFNPLGVQQDAIFTEGTGADYSVDILMQSKGEVTSDGYVVEVAVPFSSLRYQAGEDKLWGMHVFREIKRLNNEVISWMPIMRGQPGILNQAGLITGLTRIAAERTFEIIPSLTVSETGVRLRTQSRAAIRANPGLEDPGHFVNKPVGLDPGLTLKMGLTNTVILDVAVNPDFAQVEADAPVITANQRFPIFFDEKRPFFLEGIDIFRTQLNAVHTRTIIDPDLAVKLTGKSGRNSFGLMVASDNAPGNFSEEERTDLEVLPSIARFIDKNAYVGVARLKRDIGKESNIGMLATSYNFIEKHNTVGGFDGRFRLNPNTVFDFQALGTTSRRFFFDPDLGRSLYRTGNGFGYAVGLEQSGRHFGFEFNGEGRTRDYRADVGFTRRTGTNSESLTFRYFSEPNPNALLMAWRLTTSVSANFDWRARIQNWGNLSRLILIMPKQTVLSMGFNQGYERIFEEEFGPRRTETRRGAFAGDDPERSTNQKTLIFSGETTPDQKYSFAVAFGYVWGAFDYDLGAPPHYPRTSPTALLTPNGPLDPGPGNLLQFQTAINYQPVAALKTSLLYTKSRLTRHDNGRVAFDDNIISSRTTYQFTRFLFARSRIDYSTLSARARGQFLLGWAPNPGTAFYAGYNDDVSYNGFNPFTAHREDGFNRFGRSFYIKMSYLIRK